MYYSKKYNLNVVGEKRRPRSLICSRSLLVYVRMALLGKKDSQVTFQMCNLKVTAIFLTPFLKMYNNSFDKCALSACIIGNGPCENCCLYFYINESKRVFLGHSLR